jgi:hypothetical protein
VFSPCSHQIVGLRAVMGPKPERSYLTAQAETHRSPFHQLRDHFICDRLTLVPASDLELWAVCLCLAHRTNREGGECWGPYLLKYPTSCFSPYHISCTPPPPHSSSLLPSRSWLESCKSQSSNISAIVSLRRAKAPVCTVKLIKQ